MSEFQTNKSNLTIGRIVQTESVSIGDGQIKVRVDRFAFTANNITYAVMGEQLRYWEFFQPQGENADEWGIIPVWGFADIVESNSDEIPVGERLFGYFPPAQELAMTPSKVSAGAFMEGSEHRSSLPPGYNLYRRMQAEPNYDRASDDERMLLFVLHLTSYCLHDMLESNDWYGAQQVIVISASSKTSTGLGYGLTGNEDAPSVIGLTSSGNLGFVNKINAYDQVLSYDQISEIDASLPTVIVDMSANSRVIANLHTHLGDNMRFTSNVGLTHWDEAKPVAGINTERSQMFFAPSHIQQRIKEWGREEFDRKSMAYIADSIGKSRAWMKLKELDGLNDLAGIYPDVCAGSVAPDEGLIVVM